MPVNNKFSATLVCHENNVPYRLFVNEELITERLYSFPESIVVSNTVFFEIEHSDTYNVVLQNMSNTIVEILEWKVVKDEI